jgi:hypothetical protein
MAREAKMPFYWRSGEITYLERLKVFEALVRADERMSFYGQDKPVECTEGCPPNQICDYCQVVAPVKAMILAEREACAKVCDDLPAPDVYSGTDKSMWDVTCVDCAEAIRARGETK